MSERCWPRMRNIKRFYRSLACMLLLAAALCGCSPRDLLTEATPTFQGTGQVTLRPSATAQRGGVLRIPMPLQPKTLHPLFIAESQMSNVYSMIFESLITFNERMEPTAQLAAGWEYSEAEGVFIIRLRSGVRWHNSSAEVTASDVEFTINTILQNEASVYHKTVSRYIQAVVVRDMNTIAITPKTKGYEFYFALRFPIIPMSTYAGETEQCSVLPVGSGPFAVTSAVFENGKTQMNFSANAQWWKKQPYIERVEAKGYADNDDMIEAFMAGELDCVPTSKLTTDVYTTFDGVSYYEYQSRYYDFLAPNLKKSLFQDLTLRQALSYAIDRNSLISTVYLNHGIIAELPFAPDSFLNNTSIVRYDYNLSQATALLEQSGWMLQEDGIRYKNGKKLSFTITCLSNDADPVRKETAQTIRKQLALAGVEVTVRALPSDELAQAIADGDYEMLLTGYYLCDVPSAAFALSAGGEGNLSFYRDAEMDRLIKECAQMTDKEAFSECYAQLQAYAAQQIPHIGLLFHRQTLLHRGELVPMNIVRDTSVYENIDKWYFTSSS